MCTSLIAFKLGNHGDLRAIELYRDYKLFYKFWPDEGPIKHNSGVLIRMCILSLQHHTHNSKYISISLNTKMKKNSNKLEI